MSLQIAFFGDDFTGSTDVLEVLAMHGLKSRLFLAPPDAAQLAQYPGLEAAGVAGVTRSLPPEQLGTVLASAFAALSSLRPRILHYKICSTFDSSPTIGSIGRAIEIGLEATQTRVCPVVVGAPRLKRWVAFGNLFASFGSERYRLDRHPVMSRHPVTPMRESDLSLILRAQTDIPIHLVDHIALDTEGLGSFTPAPGITVFDTMSEVDLQRIGQWFLNASQDQTVFTASSSGFEYAWVAAHGLTPCSTWAPEPTTGPLLVMSGSASEVTAGQIRHWRESGGITVALDFASDKSDDLREVVKHLAQGSDVLIHTCEGPGDPRLASSVYSGREIAAIQADFLKQILRKVVPGRLCIAGGDTSGYAMKALEVESLEFLRPLAPGSPLCRLTAPNQHWSGMAVVLKGGQVGGSQFFHEVQRGAVD